MTTVPRIESLILLMLLLSLGCQQRASLPSLETTAMAAEATTTQSPSKNPTGGSDKLEKATFGEGCFWCTEAVFQNLRGVKSVVSGYSGGTVENPTYED